MSQETIALIVTIAVAIVGGTWSIRSKLSDIEKAVAALGVRVVVEEKERKQLTARVVRLEAKRKSR